MAVADLWIQQRANEGSVQFRKLPGTENTSDIMTKPVEADVLDKHMQELPFEFREGRHKEASAYTGAEDGTPYTQE